MRTKLLLGAIVIAMVTAVPIVANAIYVEPTPVWDLGVRDSSSIDLTDPDIWEGVGVWADANGYITIQDWEAGGLDTFYSAGDAVYPAISSEYVVWTEKKDDASGDIYAADLLTKTPVVVAAGAAEQNWPAIYDDRVVYTTRSGSEDFEIEFADLSASTTMALTNDAFEQYDPVIASETVVWVDDRNGNEDLYGWDLVAGEEIAITVADGMQRKPAIDGDRVVWQDSRSGGWDIYMKDLSTGEEVPVCTADSLQERPDIRGDVIVWYDQRNGHTDIYAYDISEGKEWRVTEDTGSQYRPATDGYHIVWSDERNKATTGIDVWGCGFDIIPPTTESDLSDHIGVTPSGGSEPRATYVGEAEITLTAEDNKWGSGLQKTWYKVDYVGEYYEGPFKVTRPGEHVLHFKSYDNVDNLESYNVEYFDVISTNTTYTALEGPTRYDTAVVSSQKAFPKGSSTVVIATGVNWPDALGGAALAKKKNGPILLTHPNAMTSAVIEEIERLDPDCAYILGGEAAVSFAVEDELEAMLGAENVKRIAGANRYETANLIAEEVVGDGSTYKVFVATGKNFPDALGASPLATLGPWPIVLAPEGAGLPDSTLATIDEIGAKYGVLLGGEAAVSAEVETQLTEAFGEGKVQRLSGATRYDTAIECAKFGINHGLMWDGLALSTGANFPDALAGGILQGQADSVLLLTPSGYLHPSVAEILEENRDWIGNVTYLGGTAAVSQDVRDEVESILKPPIE